LTSGGRPRKAWRASIASGGFAAQFDVAGGQGAGAEIVGREVAVAEEGELVGEDVGVGAGQAGAAEHEVDTAGVDVFGDAAPEQLHHGAER
jgi:hypothetical protein